MALDSKTEIQQFKVVGTRPLRPDGVDKVTGRARFGADMTAPGMLIGRVLRSPHAHARIRAIDTSKAEALAGVKAVVTRDDFPPIGAGEVIVPTLIAEGRSSPLTPATLLYSPEYRPASGASGRVLLERLAERTGGGERLSVEQIWDDMPIIRDWLSLAPIGFFLAAVLFFLEIAERRLGVLTGLAASERLRALRATPERSEKAERSRRVAETTGKLAKPGRVSTEVGRSGGSKQTGPPSDSAGEAERPKSRESESNEGVLGALDSLNKSKRPK